MTVDAPKVGTIATTGTNTATSLDVPMPAGVVAGEILEIHLSVTTATAGVAPTLTVPSGFVLPGTNFAVQDDTSYLAVYFKVATATEVAAANLTVGVSGHNGRLIGQVISRPGARIPTNADGVTGVLATSVATHTAAFTLTETGYFVVSIGNRSNFTALTYPSLTLRGNLAGTNTGLAVLDSGAELAAGAVSRTITLSGSSSAGTRITWAAYSAVATITNKVYLGSTPSKAFYVGSTPAKALYLGNTLVWGTAVTGSTNPTTPTDTFRLMVDEPDIATNAGLGKYGKPAEAGLTAHSGTFTVTSAMSGQTISNRNISGNVIIDAGVTEVHFVNCLIRGVGFTGSDLIKINAPVSANITFDFCEIRSDDNWIGAIGIGRDGMVVRRCYIHHLTDTIRVTGNDVVVEGNVLGPLLLVTPDIQTRDDNKTHSDVIQFEGGARASIRGNKLFGMHTTDGSSNVTYIKSADPFTPTTSTDPAGRIHPQALSCLMFTPNVGPITDFLVEGNWFYGGEIAVNAGSSGNAESNGIFRNNQFDRNQWYPGHTIDLDPTATNITATGNVYMDNGTVYADNVGFPVTVRRNA